MKFIITLPFIIKRYKIKPSYHYCCVRNINTISKIPSPNVSPNPNLNQSTLQVPSFNDTRSLESCNQKVNNLVLNPENRLTIPNSLKRSHSDISSNKGINDEGHLTKKPLKIDSRKDTEKWLDEEKRDIPEDSNVPQEYQQEPVRIPVSSNQTVEQLEIKLNQTKNEIYRLTDEVESIFEQVEEYVGANGDMLVRVAQSTPWNNRILYSEDVSPVHSVRSVSESDNANVALDDQSDNGNVALDDKSDNGNVALDNKSDNRNVATDNNNELLPDNTSSRVSDLDNNEILSNASSRFSGSDQAQGYEPLDSGLPLNDVEYTGMFRFDNIIHNNYIIYLQGEDTVDYRMAYEYLIDSLNNLDSLIHEHQNLMSVETNILQKNVDIVTASESISHNIDLLLELISSIN